MMSKSALKVRYFKVFDLNFDFMNNLIQLFDFKMYLFQKDWVVQNLFCCRSKSIRHETEFPQKGLWANAKGFEKSYSKCNDFNFCKHFHFKFNCKLLAALF